jgi:heat shock protein HslJ
LRDRRRFIPALVCVLLAVTGCADRDDADDITPTQSPTGVSLDGRTFISERVDGHELVKDTAIRLTFKDGQLGAQAGCNSLGAPYSVEGDTLALEGAGMFMTEMGCDEARHEQDEWLSDFLMSDPSFELDGDELTLTSDEVTIEFLDRETADPDRKLVGTTWRVDTILDGDSASSVPGVVTLEFTDDRSFTVTAKDCTSANGSVEIGDGTLDFGGFTVDDIGCPSPWQETLNVLRAGETTYTIEASRLTIEADTKGIGAIAKS